MKAKFLFLSFLFFSLIMVPTTVNAETVSENEIYDDVPAVIEESSLDGTPVTSEEVEALTEEEIAETLSGANNTSADFIERLYNVALDRPSEEAGKQDWLNRLNEGSTGADLAKGFLYSQEFLNKGTSNDQFLTVLYKTFFDRDPDEAGKAGWMKALNEGTSRQQIVDGFIGSQEYSNLCATYRIDPGTGVIPNIEVEPTQEIIGFSTRLYSTCLNRTPDAGGLNNWSKLLACQQISGTKAAEGFFFSDEFVSSNTSDAEYVLRLYKTFFNREPDREGYSNWLVLLKDGYSRKYVFNGFANSTEWKQLCRTYGIASGTTNPEPEPAVHNIDTSRQDNCHHIWYALTTHIGVTGALEPDLEYCKVCGLKRQCITHNDGTGYHIEYWK